MFGGYKRGGRTQLLDDVADSFEDVWRERGELADSSRTLEKQLDELKQREALLARRSIAAEQAAAEVRSRAKREAELILAEAHQESRSITRAAQSERERLFAEARRVRRCSARRSASSRRPDELRVAGDRGTSADGSRPRLAEPRGHDGVPTADRPPAPSADARRRESGERRTERAAPRPARHAGRRDRRRADDPRAVGPAEDFAWGQAEQLARRVTHCARHDATIDTAEYRSAPASRSASGSPQARRVSSSARTPASIDGRARRASARGGDDNHLGDTATATYDRELDAGPRGGRAADARPRSTPRSRKIEDGTYGIVRGLRRSRSARSGSRRSRGRASASTTSGKRRRVERAAQRAPDVRVGSSTDGLAPVSVAERSLAAGPWQWAGLPPSRSRRSSPTR